MMARALEEAFGPGAEAVTVTAPGRVNLIGEHTDYNDGFVLPMAIDHAVEMAARPRAGPEIRIRAVDLGETAVLSSALPIATDPERPWSNYVRGVLWALARAGFPAGGMDLAFGGNLPQGAGLASSAALEVATALAAAALGGLRLEVADLARLCQRAENEFVGVQCGIMDPFVSLAAKAGHALLLDCRSLEFRHVPLPLAGHAVAICHSGVRHALVASEYNRRRRECADGVEALRRRFPEVRALRDATLEQLEASRPAVSPVVYRRCRHVVAENARVIAAAGALQEGDLERFGRLMDASHASLRDDYEVSCPEIDLLVELARRSPGVLGSRITGGGFGGCTVSLVAREAVDAFREGVLGEYARRTGLCPRLLVSAAARGALTH